MTTFAELLAGLDDEEILDRFAELFPDPGPAYRKVLGALRGMDPEPPPYVLSLHHVDSGVEQWVSAHGVEDGIPYAIEYEPWARWLGMDIAVGTLRDFPAVDIAAHALWEMTYAGFDEATIAAQLQEIVDAHIDDDQQP